MRNRTDFCIDLFAFTIHSPAWETAPISASICSPSIRSPAWNRTDFCTSDHLGITHGRKTVSPLKNPCDSDSFWSQLTIDVRFHENQFLYARSRMKRHLSLFFLFTAERRLTADHLDKIFCTRLRSRMGAIFRSLLSTAERLLTADHLDKIFCTRLRSSMGGIFRSLLYLLLSIGSLEQFWIVITLELRASFSDRRSSRPFFLNVFLVSHGLY